MVRPQDKTRMNFLYCLAIPRRQKVIKSLRNANRFNSEPSQPFRRTFLLPLSENNIERKRNKSAKLWEFFSESTKLVIRKKLLFMKISVCELSLLSCVCECVRSWASNRSTAMGHTGYCGQGGGSHVATESPKLFVIFIVQAVHRLRKWRRVAWYRLSAGVGNSFAGVTRQMLVRCRIKLHSKEVCRASLDWYKWSASHPGRFKPWYSPNTQQNCIAFVNESRLPIGFLWNFFLYVAVSFMKLNYPYYARYRGECKALRHWMLIKLFWKHF